MRTKSFLLFLCCIVGVSLVLIVFGPDRSASIQNIMTSTHQHIRNFQDTLRDAEQKLLVADEKYLKLLGFTENPRLYPNATWHNTSLPVIVTYVLDGHESQAVGLINSVSRVMSNNTILVYNLGLGTYRLQTLLNYCNNSRCQVINYELGDFPSHVGDEVLHAYRPLIIQDALQRTGAILFLESYQRLQRITTADMIESLFEKVLKGSGILAWPMRNAVSSLTHKKMFDYFRTDAENFLFLQMVDADKLLIVNTRSIHNDVMLPWIKCALTQDCIYPIGAQSGGCRFDKKPQYRYSGCHSYDVSALNIILGLRHRLDNYRYTDFNKEVLFRQVSLEKAQAELASLERNSTTVDAKTVSDISVA